MRRRPFRPVTLSRALAETRIRALGQSRTWTCLRLALQTLLAPVQTLDALRWLGLVRPPVHG